MGTLKIKTVKVKKIRFHIFVLILFALIFAVNKIYAQNCWTAFQYQHQIKESYQEFNTVSGGILTCITDTINHKTKYGIKNGNQKQIIPCIYDYIESDCNTYTVYIGNIEEGYKLNGGKFGVISDYGSTIIPTEYDYIRKEFNERLYIVGKKDTINNKLTYGIYDGLKTANCICKGIKKRNKIRFEKNCDNETSPLTSIDYDKIYDYNSSYYILYSSTSSLMGSKKGYYRIYSTRKRDILPVVYDFINGNYNFLITFKGETDSLGNPLKGLFGLATSNELLEPKYQSLEFSDNILLAKYNDLYGCIDFSGNVVIPLLYDTLIRKNKYLNCFSFKLNNEMGIVGDSICNCYDWFGGYGIVFKGTINQEGKPIKGKYGTLNSIKKKYVPVAFDSIIPIGEMFLFITKKDSLYGLYDFKNGELITPQYQELKPIFARESEIRINVRGYSNFLIAKKNCKWGTINKSNNLLSEFKYDSLYQYDNYSHELYCKLNNRIGIINNKGVEILPPIFSQINKKDDNKYKVFKVDTIKHKAFYGYFDLNGKEIIPCNYTKADFINNMRDKLKIYYVMKRDGKENDLTNRGKWGLISERGKIISECKYDFISYYYPFIVSIGKYENGNNNTTYKGKYGMIDTTGSEIIPVKYDWIKPSINKEYYIVFEGETSKTKDGIIPNKGKFGVVSKNGTTIPCKYDCIEINDSIINIYEGLIDFSKKENICKKGYIDENGNEVWIDNNFLLIFNYNIAM